MGTFCAVPFSSAHSCVLELLTQRLNALLLVAASIVLPARIYLSPTLGSNMLSELHILNETSQLIVESIGRSYCLVNILIFSLSLLSTE